MIAEIYDSMEGSRFFMRKKAAACLLALLIPYITTLAWTGRVEGSTQRIERTGKVIRLDRGETSRIMDREEYLIGILAVQIPPEYEMEALKAQAILARTAICRQMQGTNEIPESALDMDYLEQGQMEALWGREAYLENYKRLRTAVQETAGQVIKYQGDYIEPLFHRLSAGKTRAGDDLHPYLVSVEAAEDLQGENYIGIFLFTREELAEKLNSMPEPPDVAPEEVLESIQIIKKDSAGYVESIQVGTKSYTGDEIRYALGLPSGAYRFESAEGGVRCTVRGIGHGYGLDQYGADRKAAKGWTAEKILEFYYKNIVIVSE